LVVICLSMSGRARAQLSDPDRRPTRGPLITGAARAGDADATGVQLNPGALGLLGGNSLELVGAGAGSGEVVPGRGAALYFGTPIFGRGGTLGIGIGWVAGASEVGNDARTTFRLAYGLRLGRHLGIGAAWAHVAGGRFGGTDTFDLGASLRAGRYLAVGATVEDVGAPHPAGLPQALPRLWTAELAVRPLGTNRIEIGLGAAHAENDAWRRIVPRARLWVGLRPGLRFYADASTLPNATALAFERDSDSRIGLGLAIDLDHSGLATSAVMYSPGSDYGGPGIAARAHFESERRPAVATSLYIARVSLEGIDDERDFVKLVQRLRGLALEPGVAGVMFKIRRAQLGMARIEELRELVALLRSKRKRTFAYIESAGTREYLLAAATDHIVFHPAAELALTGVAQNVTFYKGAMDRIGVHVDLVRIGAFKGAMEPFILNEQSPEVRANKNRILDDVFGRLVSTLAEDRTRAGQTMDAAKVKAFVDRGIFNASSARDAGLADGVADHGELEGHLGRTMGRAGVPLRDPDSAPLARPAWPGRRIVVLLAEGNIVDGKSRDTPLDIGTFAGSETLVAALEECRRDPSIGAIVLRVNSPGGSAFASDVISRAVTRTRAAGKPVVVSMGDHAASGGYYIAAPADVVFADPSTITGSIGIFGFKADAGQLMNLLGLSVETYRRGAHADYQSPYRPWTEDEIKIAMDKIRHLYALFIETVANGRRSKGMTPARVDEIGRGQVWTGALAQGLGLVDRMGGVSAAIDEAARLGRVPLGRDGLPEIHVLPRPASGLLRQLTAVGGLLADSDTEAAPAPIKPAELLLPEGRAALRLLAPLLFAGGSGFEARLPYDIELR
jgi:protease IV